MHADLCCTYRLQLAATFDLSEAAKVVPYLATLGVSHLYLSPVLQAQPASSHGYDVADPTRISAQLGGRHALDALFVKLRQHEMAAILDIVPNHLTATAPKANAFTINPSMGSSNRRLPPHLCCSHHTFR